MPSGYVYSWVNGSVSFNTPKSWYNTTAGAPATAVPGASDEALIVASGSVNGPGSVFELGLTGTGSGLAVGGTLVGSYIYVGGTVALSSGAEIYTPNLIDIGDDSNNTIAGKVPTTLTVAKGSILYGSLATANGFDVLIGQYGGSGTLAVEGGLASSGPDGYWIGNEGSGLISITDGGSVVGGVGTGVAAQQIGLALGIEGGAGTLNVSGQSSAAEFLAIVEVGFGGSGSISIGSGGYLQAGNGLTSLNIGDTYDNAKGIGTVSISGGSAYLNGLIDDGANGYGHFNLSNGATVTAVGTASTIGSFSALLGGSAGSSGTLSIASQSEMQTEYGLAVGSEGVGELDVSSAMLVVNAAPGPQAVALEAGVAAGAIGAVNVSGGTILDTRAAGFVIGGAGAGTLTVTQLGSQGGVVLTGDPTTGTGLAIGVSSGSSGLVSVSGSASGIGVYGGITDGGSGSGTLDVSGGARLSAGDSYAAASLVLGAVGGTGTMAVSSLGQALVYGQTDVGQSGTGSLSITGGSSFEGLASGTSALVVGVSNGVTGSVLISDASTYVPLVGGVVVGSSGSGSLAIQRNAEVFVSGISTPSTPGVIVAASAGSRGTLSIASQAILTTSNGVAVGSEGSGELDVSSATLVVNAVPAVGTAALDAGVSAGATGVINVAGGVINDTLSAGMILGAAGTGTLNISQVGTQGGLVLTGDPTGNSGLALGISSGSSGVVVVSGAASGLGVYGTVIDGSSGVGGITLSNGARFIAGDAADASGLVLGGSAGGEGSVVVSGGAQASVLGQTVIGQGGSGNLYVIGGSSFTGDANGFPALIVGASANGTGSVQISGVSTYVPLTGGLVVGSQGVGSLALESNAILSVIGSSADNVPGVVIADHTDSVGTLSVTSQAEMLASFGIAVGSFGDGVLNVLAGTLVSSVSPAAGLAALDAGVEAGSSGTVNVTGGLIEDTQSAGMIIGQFGAGTLTIAQSGSIGGTVLTGDPSTTGLSIGMDSGASGTVSVSGTASGLGVYGSISDGGAGSGVISLTAGARLSAGAGAGAQSLLIGGAGGSGSVSVAGGAFASVLGEVLVGNGGAGTLSVTGGGSMIVTASTADALVVGGASGGSGSVLIGDAGSFISLGSGLQVGATGTVTVQNNAQFRVAGATVDLGGITTNGASMSFIGGVSGAGSLSIEGNGVLTIGANAIDSTNVAFGPGGGTLAAASATDITGTITGWSSGDFVSLTNTVVTTEQFANGTLSLFGSNSALVGSLTFGGALSSGDFTLTAAGGGTVIGYHAPLV